MTVAVRAAVRLLGAGVLALWLGVAGAGPAPAGVADACPPPPAPLTAADVDQGLREAVDRGALWALRRGGRTSWLYGTIHVARRGWMFPGPQVRQAIESADRVALELDLLDPDVSGRLVRSMAAAPDAAPLPEPVASRLRRWADSVCAGPELAALKPELQAVTLTLLAARRLGLEPGYGVDGFLAGFARGRHKPVLSLETPEGQTGLLLQPTPAQTARFVDHVLSELDGAQALPTLARLADDWARGHWDDLERYPEWCGCLDDEADRALMRRLNDERNLAMAARIEARHAAGERLFVAVGTLHMIGPQGLPALLAGRGFEVRRVVPAPAPPLR